MGKKSKLKKNKNPLVSILTPTFRRSKLLRLVAKCIVKQDYPQNRMEWIIVDGENDEKYFDSVPKILKEISNEYPNLKIVYDLCPMTENNMIGGLRNRTNELANGEIMVCMDDDDYYCPERVSDAVKSLKHGKLSLAGSSKMYMYDFDTDAFIEFGPFNSNHGTNNTFAYNKKYAKNNKYDSKVSHAEERSFTNNFKNSMVQLNPETTVLQFSHLDNTYNKRNLLEGAYYHEDEGDKKGKMYRVSKKSVFELIPKVNFEEYENVLLPYERHSIYVPYDIVFYCGTLSFKWDPDDPSLGGSEQAVIELSSYWASKGYKVAVYGKISKMYGYRGVDYFQAMHFKVSLRYKRLILWRAFGFNSMIKWNLKADKIYLDLHDTVAINPNYIIKNVDKLDGIFVKSQFHGHATYQYTGKNDKIASKLRVIMNGVRVERFKENKGYERNDYRLCYASCYTRGLMELLKYFYPRLKELIPEAELHIYYGYPKPNNFKDFNNELKNLIDSNEGVYEHGRVGMDKIIEEKYKSSFHLYFTETNSETDCITVRESLVTGCIPIISNYGVFMERDGLKFNLSSKDSESYLKIAETVAKIMKDKEKLNEIRKNVINSKTIIDWNEVGDKWLECMNMKRQQSKELVKN